MHKSCSVQKFYSRAKSDQFFKGRTQHISNEQAKGGADALASRGEQMLKGGTQIGM
jgi:hypothetical protein